MIVDVLGEIQAQAIETAFKKLNTEEVRREYFCRECEQVHSVTFSYTRNRYGGLDYREAIVDGRVLYSHVVI